MWDQFTGKICSFFETGKTETVVSVCLPRRRDVHDLVLTSIQTGGTARRGGPKVQKVMRFSAVVGIGQERSVPIISNHTHQEKKIPRVDRDTAHTPHTASRLFCSQHA
jgi:hypothetical protein